MKIYTVAHNNSLYRRPARVEFDSDNFADFKGTTDKEFIDYLIRNCKDLSGLNFDKMDLSNLNFEHKFLSGCSFKQAKLDGASFYNCTLNESCFTLANIDHADFRYAELAGASFFAANGKEVRFDKAKLSKTDFRKAKLDEANFSLTDITDCMMIATQLKESDFQYTTLNNVNTRGANFTNAVLDGARFAGCTLAGTTFRNATFNDSSFNNVDLKDAIFINAQLKRIKVDFCDFNTANITGATISYESKARTNINKDELMYIAEISCNNISHPLCNYNIVLKAAKCGRRYLVIGSSIKSLSGWKKIFKDKDYSAIYPHYISRQDYRKVRAAYLAMLTYIKNI